jgi:hypothetical protein
MCVLILWTPQLEGGNDAEGDLTFRRHPLSYWLDYLRAFAGKDSSGVGDKRSAISALLIQSQCDTPAQRAALPPVDMDGVAALQPVQVSAKTGLGLDPPAPIGVGRAKVRDRLRQMLREDQQREPSQRKHRLLVLQL